MWIRLKELVATFFATAADYLTSIIRRRTTYIWTAKADYGNFEKGHAMTPLYKRCDHDWHKLIVTPHTLESVAALEAENNRHRDNMRTVLVANDWSDDAADLDMAVINLVEWQAAELARVREERDTLKKILEQDCKDWAENDDKLAKDLEEYRINDGYFQSGYDLVDCCIADRNKLRSELALAREERDRIADLLETAFGIIANATSGNWLKEGEWLFAANKFRDAYNAWLNGYVATLPPPEAK